MRLQPLFWSVLMGLCAAACGDDADKDDKFGREPKPVGGERNPSTPVDPAGSNTRDGDAGATTPATGLDGGILDGGSGRATGSAPDACVPGPLAAPPPTACAESDYAEPNSFKAPAIVPLESACTALTALTSGPDEDAYRFVATKSDPVRFELSYDAADRTDLWFDLADQAGPQTSFGNVEARGTRLEQILGVYKPKAGEPLDLRIHNRQIGACQSYTLRVDTSHCSDAYEDNDVETAPAKLTLDAAGKAEATGTAHQLDYDFFEIATPKADPFLITGTYTAGPNDTLTIRRIVRNAAGQSVVDVNGERKALTGTFSHWVDSDAVGGTYKLWLWPTGSGCVPFTVSFDTAACTDPLEDNDSAQTSAKLALATDVQATSISTDRDFYDIAELATGGTCTISYTVAEGFSSKLRVSVTGFDGQTVANALGGEGSGPAKTMKLSWGDRGAARITVDQDIANVCQPYTIRCDKSAPAAP